MYSSSPPRSPRGLARSSTTTNVGGRVGISSSPFVDDLYVSSPSRRTLSPSSTLPRTSGERIFDDLPLHLHSRLSDSRDYLRSRSGNTSPFTHRVPSPSRRPRESSYAVEHESNYTPSYSRFKTSTLNPRDYTSSGYSSFHGSSRSPVSSTQHSPSIPRRDYNSNYRPSKTEDFWPVSRSGSSGLGSVRSSSPLPPISSTTTEPVYKSLASRVFSPDHKPDSNILDLDIDSKALIAESNKQAHELDVTVNQGAKMLHEMDGKLYEMELRRKRREASSEKDGIHSGRNSPYLSPEYKHTIEMQSRSRERTPVSPIDHRKTDSDSDSYMGNSTVVRRKKVHHETESINPERKDRNETVFEVEVNDEDQVLRAAKDRTKWQEAEIMKNAINEMKNVEESSLKGEPQLWDDGTKSLDWSAKLSDGQETSSSNSDNVSRITSSSVPIQRAAENDFDTRSSVNRKTQAGDKSSSNVPIIAGAAVVAVIILVVLWS